MVSSQNNRNPARIPALGFRALALVVLSILLTGHVMDVTTVVLFVAAIQMLAIGMIADIIDRRLS